MEGAMGYDWKQALLHCVRQCFFRCSRKRGQGKKVTEAERTKEEEGFGSAKAIASVHGHNS
jgi:hypothetical protein